MPAGGATRAQPGPSEVPLPLELPAPSPLPGRIRPEAAVPCIEAFDHPEWRFTVDWEGSRALLFAGSGAVRLQDETLADVTLRYPEMQAARRRLGERALVLDGAVVVLDPDGRPDLTSLGLRLALGASGARSLPAVYLANDILYLDGSPTLSWPLDRRLAVLREVLEGCEPIQAPDHVDSRGRALADAASARDLNALLARRGDAPYRPGIASPDRLRVALDQRTTCAVAAVTSAAPGRSRGMVLAELQGARWVIAGWVEAPADRVVSRWVERLAETLGTDAPFLDAPAQGASVRWLRPGITATVVHEGRHADGTLSAPALVAVRDDCDPTWCVRRAAVAPPEVDEARRGFVPTVLLPLPLDEASLLPHVSR